MRSSGRSLRPRSRLVLFVMSLEWCHCVFAVGQVPAASYQQGFKVLHNRMKDLHVFHFKGSEMLYMFNDIHS